LYVDDFAHWYEAEYFDLELVAMLESYYGKLSIARGEKGIYVGVEYHYNYPDGSVALSMDKYLTKVFKDFNVQKGSATPTATDFMNINHESPRIDSKRFASGVMTVFYAALRVRKDVLFPITVLATRIVDAREDDLKKFTRVLRYLYETKDYVVVLRTRGTRLIFSVDASYAIHENSRSHSGLHVTLGGDVPPELGYGGPIFTRSNSQKLVALSSYEAELNAIHNNIMFVAPLRLFMSEIGYDQSKPSLLLQDNQATIHSILHGPSAGGRAAHVRVRINNLKEYCDGGELLPYWVATEEMSADGLTKAFSSVNSQPVLQRLLNNYR
jgi:hypothetical protein